MIVYAPDAIPAPPIPAMARPTIKAVLFGATPMGFGVSLDGVKVDFEGTYRRSNYLARI